MRLRKINSGNRSYETFFRCFIDLSYCILFFLSFLVVPTQRTSRRHIGDITPRILILLQNVNGAPIRSPNPFERYKHVNDRLSGNRQHLCQRHSALIVRYPANAIRIMHKRRERVATRHWPPHFFSVPTMHPLGVSRYAGVTISRMLRYECCTVMPNSGTLHSTSFTPIAFACTSYIVPILKTAVRCSSECICCGQREFLARVDKIVVSQRRRSAHVTNARSFNSLGSTEEKKTKKY